jgi:hypothetical protein
MSQAYRHHDLATTAHAPSSSTLAHGEAQHACMRACVHLNRTTGHGLVHMGYSKCQFLSAAVR